MDTPGVYGGEQRWERVDVVVPRELPIGVGALACFEHLSEPGEAGCLLAMRVEE